MKILVLKNGIKLEDLEAYDFQIAKFRDGRVDYAFYRPSKCQHYPLVVKPNGVVRIELWQGYSYLPLHDKLFDGIKILLDNDLVEWVESTDRDIWED